MCTGMYVCIGTNLFINELSLMSITSFLNFLNGIYICRTEKCHILQNQLNLLQIDNVSFSLTNTQSALQSIKSRAHKHASTSSPI